MKNIRFAALDIDGVSKPRGSETPTNAMQGVFKSLAEKNVLATVATGRGFLRAIDIVRPYVNGPLIVDDGAQIVDINGNTLIRHTIEDDILEILEEQFGDLSIDFAGFPNPDTHRYTLYVPNDTRVDVLAGQFAPVLQEIVRLPNEFLDLAHRWGITKLSIIPEKNSQVVLDGRIPNSFNEGTLNINPRSINKGTGVRELAALYDISLDEVLVAGNDYNDIPMFKIDAAIRIAVGDDAPKAVKERATHFAVDAEILPVLIQEVMPYYFETRESRAEVHRLKR